MKNNLHKLWKVTAASLVLLTSLFGQASANNWNSYDSCNPCCEDDCGSFIVGADWLYWQANTCGLAYGSFITRTLESGSENRQLGFDKLSGQFKDLSYDWDSGVRLTLGWRAPCNDWDGMLKWTHLNTSASGSVANTFDFSADLPTTSTFFLPSWGSNMPTRVLGGSTGEQTASAKWKLNLDMVDLELGREFLICDCVAMRPHVGLRYAKLDQKFNLNSEILFNPARVDFAASAAESEDFENCNLQKVSAKNNFEGGGIRGGVDADWCFGCFGIYGNVGASLVYGRFDVSTADDISLTQSTPIDSEPIETTEAVLLNQNTHFHSTTPMSDLGIGVRWDQSFDCDRMNLSIKLGWEHHYFWNQNNFISGQIDFERSLFETTVDTDSCARGGIGLQGLTLSAMLEF